MSKSYPVYCIRALNLENNHCDLKLISQLVRNFPTEQVSMHTLQQTLQPMHTIARCITYKFWFINLDLLLQKLICSGSYCWKLFTYCKIILQAILHTKKSFRRVILENWICSCSWSLWQSELVAVYISICSGSFWKKLICRESMSQFAAGQYVCLFHAWQLKATKWWSKKVIRPTGTMQKKTFTGIIFATVINRKFIDLLIILSILGQLSDLSSIIRRKCSLTEIWSSDL